MLVMGNTSATIVYCFIRVWYSTIGGALPYFISIALYHSFQTFDNMRSCKIAQYLGTEKDPGANVLFIYYYGLEYTNQNTTLR